MYQPAKYRLYPFPNQERELLRQFEELCFLWNYALERRQEAWKKEHRSVSYVDQCRDLARWRAYDTEGIGSVYSHVARETLARLDDGFKHFFRRVKEAADPASPATNGRSPPSPTRIPTGRRR
ncbi:MAG: helix-turn-helix domain-containing protein [Thermoplasmata archaeon]